MASTLAATLRTSACIFSRVMVGSAARHGNKASSHVRTGSVACCSPGGRNGFSFTPACFITSDAFLNRLATDKVAEAADGSFHQYAVSVPADSGEQLSLLLRHPNQPEDSKILRVAVIGAPNAGKSTLSNQLLGRKVFAVSKKVHTTRSRALGVLTEDATQIILLDTPGLTTPSKVKRHQLERSLLVDPWNTVKEADFLVVMVDVAERWRSNALDFEVLRCLAQHADIPAVLVLNKVDLVKSKMRLLAITEELTCGVVGGRRLNVKPTAKPPPWGAEKRPTTSLDEGDDATEPGGGSAAAAESRPLPPGAPLSAQRLKALSAPLSAQRLKALSAQRGWHGFKDVFMLSSLDREDVETLKRYLVAAARPGAWQYHSDVLTDQCPQDVCTSIIREKLLEHLPQEVPYSMKQSVDLWQDGANGELIIAVKLYVMKDTHVAIVIGTTGQMVARMAREAEEDLSRVFLREVKLRLSVKLKQ